MKTKMILPLIFLLLSTLSPLHGQKAAIRIIDSSVFLAGDSVHVRLALQALRLSSDYRMDLTPVICKGVQEATLSSVRIAGRRSLRSQERKELFGRGTPKDTLLTVPASDTLFYETALLYEPWMNHALLRIDNRLSGCCSSVLLPATLADIDLALTLPKPELPPIEEPVLPPEPVIVLSPTELLAQEEGFIRRDDRYETDRQAANYYRDPDALRVFFRQGRIAIDTTYMDNASTLNRLERVLHVMTSDSTIRITRLVVAGYASVEGTLQRNTYLAGKRAEILQAYATARGVPLPAIETVNMGEGWDELRDLVATSDSVPYREEVLRIIDTVPVLKEREQRLMSLRGGVPYRWMMKYFFPRQRNAGYVNIYFEKN